MTEVMNGFCTNCKKLLAC